VNDISSIEKGTRLFSGAYVKIGVGKELKIRRRV
jgi:hypothetical protein